MAVLVNIPLAYYQAFIGRCYLESREYHVLRNAVIDHVPVHLRDGMSRPCFVPKTTPRFF